MQTKLVKIDETGKYCKFPGVTVVSAIQNKDLELWRQIYSEISKCELIKDFYALLPFESYHMTAMNIYTQKQHGGSDWKGFLTKDLTRLQKFNNLLIEKAFSPEVLIDSLLVNERLILFEVKIPKEQDSTIRSIARQYRLEDDIPIIYHITIGYAYKTPDDEAILKIKEYLERNLTCLHKTFHLEEPKLCYFDDMQAFIPWNGEQYPFE